MLRAMSVPRRRLLPALVLIVTTAAAAPSSSGAAAAPGDEWLALATAMAKPWATLQRPGGAGFADYVVAAAPEGPPRDPYGRAFLGLALLQSGIRDDSDPQIAAGLRAVGYAASHPVRRDRIVFENLALETAYNVARRALATDDRFRAIRPALEARIRRTTAIQLGGARPYYNYYLVDSAGLMEALASGLTSSVRGSALANRARTRRLVEKLVNETVTRIGARYSTRGGLSILSDPPWNPPAYDALSLALLARITARLGPAATSDETRELMRGMARSLWALASPAGSVSYYGRSQDESWTLAMTAYGALATARLPGTSPADAARFEALANRALGRLRDAYAGGRFGFWITPAFARGIRGAVSGIDAYADAASYSGLTLVGLNWALEEMDGDGPAAGAIGADTPGAFRIASGPSAAAFVRTPALWFAVKQGPGVYVKGVGDYRSDVRYDGGLVALQSTAPGGPPADIVPARPHSRRRDDRAEPVLFHAGRAFRFWGTRLRTTSAGGVDLTGGFRAGSRWLRRGVRVTYRPAGCGLRESLATRRGDRIQRTLWTRGRPRISGGGRILTDRGQRVTLGSRPRRISFRGGYASGAEQQLTRVQMLFAGSGRPLTTDYCPPA